LYSGFYIGLLSVDRCSATPDSKFQLLDGASKSHGMHRFEKSNQFFFAIFTV
jgi:hypothetical protein